jgi:hypothetical protein
MLEYYYANSRAWSIGVVCIWLLTIIGRKKPMISGRESIHMVKLILERS